MIDEKDLFKIIPIDEDDSSFDRGDCGSLCFQIDEHGNFDGIYFGLKGDGWNRYGEECVPGHCNYCIPLPWDIINRKINEKCNELSKRDEV